MPILSYLALPHRGAMEQLSKDLATMDHCEIIPSDNQEVIVLITDTPDRDTETYLHKMLKKLTSLQSLSMTFGHNAES